MSALFFILAIIIFGLAATQLLGAGITDWTTYIVLGAVVLFFLSFVLRAFRGLLSTVAALIVVAMVVVALF